MMVVVGVVMLGVPGGSGGGKIARDVWGRGGGSGRNKRNVAR
jgi:hypothetical protein